MSPDDYRPGHQEVDGVLICDCLTDPDSPERKLAIEVAKRMEPGVVVDVRAFDYYAKHGVCAAWPDGKRTAIKGAFADLDPEICATAFTHWRRDGLPQQS